MGSQFNQQANRPINQPPLLSELRSRIGEVIATPCAALVWAGVVTAVMMIIPLWGAIDSLFGSSQASGDLSEGEMFELMATELSAAISHLFLGLAILAIVILPLSYGALLMALRVIRREPAARADLCAAYLHPFDFALFSAAIILVGAIPLLLWMIVGLIGGVIVGVVGAMSSDGDPSQQTMLVTVTVMAIGLPFVLLSVYFQFRFAFAGLTIIDPLAPRRGALRALADSWEMTRRQNGALSRVAIYAAWVLIRETVIGFGIGLFRRGLPEFVALIAASYEVLAARLQGQSRS